MRRRIYLNDTKYALEDLKLLFTSLKKNLISFRNNDSRRAATASFDMTKMITNGNRILGFVSRHNHILHNVWRRKQQNYKLFMRPCYRVRQRETQTQRVKEECWVTPRVSCVS